MQKLTQLTAALILASAVAAPALAAPETFVVDGTHTFPRFSYSHFGFSTQLSHFNKTTGKVVLDKPIAMEEGLKFAIREGGRTVGAGRVTKINK